MDIVNIISICLAPITGVVSWLAARRSRNNSMLQALQDSIKSLAKKNAELIEEIVELRSENAELKIESAEVKHAMSKLELQIKILTENGNN